MSLQLIEQMDLTTLPSQATASSDSRKEALREVYLKTLTDLDPKATKSLLAREDFKVKSRPRDGGDKSVSSQDFYHNVNFTNRDRKKVLILSNLLKDLESGEWSGYCASCGEEVSLRRIQARPYTRLCKECQEIDDKEEERKGNKGF